MGIYTGDGPACTSGLPLPSALRQIGGVLAMLFLFTGLLAGRSNAAVQVSPGAIKFGNVYVGSSITRSFTIKNSGSTGITLSEASIETTAFVRSKLSLPVTIGADKSLTVGITYAPTETGSRLGTIVIRTSASSAAISIPITATAVKQTLSILPVSMNFHNLVVGSSGTQSATVTNTGATSVTISAHSVSGKGFTMTGIATPLALASGKSTSFTVHFAPKSAGTESGTVSLTTRAAAGWLRMPLAGVGVAATKVLTATPSSLSFGSVADGSSASATVSVTNTGNSNLSISNVTTSGTGFETSGLLAGEVLTVGEVASLDVTFAPETAASASGTINIASNASNSPAAIALSGTGAASGQPYVVLSWTASSSSVEGYNVYRGTTSGGPYSSKLTSSPVAALTFTDTTVQAGQTYYYVVTAVSSSGVESADSSPASATVP
jgi:hypothetical protein